MMVTIDAERHAPSATAVCLVNDGAYPLLVVDAVRFALIAFVAEQHAWTWGSGNGLLQPGKLFGRQPIALVPMLEVVAAGVVEILVAMLEVIGIQHNEAEATSIEEIVPVAHPIAFQRLLVWIAVTVVVAQDMVGRNVELIVVPHIIHELLRTVREVAKMDDELCRFLLRTGQNLVQPFNVVMRKHVRIVMDVGKCAKLYG